MSSKSNFINKGVNTFHLMRCLEMAGEDGNWGGVRKVCGIGTKNTQANRRRDPETFTLREIHKYCQKTHVNSYDIMNIWFADFVETMDEKQFYADLWRRMADWMSPGTMSEKTEILEAIQTLSKKVDKLAREYRKYNREHNTSEDTENTLTT